MEPFWLVILVAVLSPGTLAIEVEPEAKVKEELRTFGLLCKIFCNQSYEFGQLHDDYYDYWRTAEDMDSPRIFCELCTKKGEEDKTTTMTPMDRTSTTASSTSAGPTSTTASSTSAGPTSITETSASARPTSITETSASSGPTSATETSASTTPTTTMGAGR